MMKVNELRRSMRQQSHTSNTTHKNRLSPARKRIRTFADIKQRIESSANSSASKSNRAPIAQKIASRCRSSFYASARPTVKRVCAADYFAVVCKGTRAEELEAELYDQLFGMPVAQSVTSNSHGNIAITGSYEFVEMNNNSVHISRVFRSQHSNSFKTPSYRDEPQKPMKLKLEIQNDKENYRNDEQRISNMLMALKKNVQFSTIDAYKKHTMVRGIVQIEDILQSDECHKSKHSSQQSFGKYLHSRQLPNSIEAFKNI